MTEQPNPIEMPDRATAGVLGNTPADLRIELRGYEVARCLEDNTWEKTATYRPTESGRLTALQACLWLSERYPKETYRLRALVSLEPPGIGTREWTSTPQDLAEYTAPDDPGTPLSCESLPQPEDFETEEPTSPARPPACVQCGAFETVDHKCSWAPVSGDEG